MTASPIPEANFVKALNDTLPATIRVLEAKQVTEHFHARKSARRKTYRYRIYRGAICPPFLARYVWHYPYPLDEDAMAEAAKFILGEHDFTSFAALIPRREPMKLHTSGKYLVHRGSETGMNFSTRWKEADSCITWCVIWSERFCWWEREPGWPPIRTGFSQKRTGHRQEPPLLHAVCGW